MNARIENDVLTIVILLSPVGLIYSWHFFFTRMRKSAWTWRTYTTLASLSIVSLAGLLIPVVMVLSPHAEYEGNYAGVPQQLEFLAAWQRPILRAVAVAFVLSFLARPRLIAPIAVACVAIAALWLELTMF